MDDPLTVLVHNDDKLCRNSPNLNIDGPARGLLIPLQLMVVTLLAPVVWSTSQEVTVWDHLQGPAAQLFPFDGDFGEVRGVALEHQLEDLAIHAGNVPILLRAILINSNLAVSIPVALLKLWVDPLHGILVPEDMELQVERSLLHLHAVSTLLGQVLGQLDQVPAGPGARDPVRGGVGVRLLPRLGFVPGEPLQVIPLEGDQILVAWLAKVLIGQVVGRIAVDQPELVGFPVVHWADARHVLVGPLVRWEDRSAEVAVLHQVELLPSVSAQSDLKGEAPITLGLHLLWNLHASPGADNAIAMRLPVVLVRDHPGIWLALLHDNQRGPPVALCRLRLNDLRGRVVHIEVVAHLVLDGLPAVLQLLGWVLIAPLVEAVPVVALRGQVPELCAHAAQLGLVVVLGII
mmetsp:Transcript_36912/g.102489  ORF Transcript_36912/g.102489 Transcript_36912/m.102489 type:complete len:404 (+) Transcript_36912:232-1443(+)